MKSCIVISPLRYCGTHLVIKMLNMIGLMARPCQYPKKDHIFEQGYDFSRLPIEGCYCTGDHNSKLLKYCTENLLGSNQLYLSHFRKGIIRDWKNYFTREHKKLFKEVAGRLLIREGYEKNTKW